MSRLTSGRMPGGDGWFSHVQTRVLLGVLSVAVAGTGAVVMTGSGKRVRASMLSAGSAVPPLLGKSVRVLGQIS